MSRYSYLSTTGIDARAVPLRRLLLGPLAELVRQKKTWSPALLPGVLGRALISIGWHRRIAKLLRDPACAQLARTNARFAFKYLTHSYLSRSFTVSERAACFEHHYSYLLTNLPTPLLHKVLHSTIALTEVQSEENRIRVTLGVSRTHDKEGELSLNLEVDGATVFVLSFTIVPGRIVGCEAENVLLISRMQGMKGCYRQIALATQAARNVAPSGLLLSVLQGFGAALQIDTLAGLCAVNQNSYGEDCAAQMNDAYDAFFTRLGMPMNEADFFTSAIPLQEKPLSLIKQGHKLRTREKRAFKREVAEHVQQTLCAHLKTNPRLLPRRGLESENNIALKNLWAGS